MCVCMCLSLCVCVVVVEMKVVKTQQLAVGLTDRVCLFGKIYQSVTNRSMCVMVEMKVVKHNTRTQYTREAPVAQHML